MTVGNKQYSTVNYYGDKGVYHSQTDVWSGTDGRTNPDGSIKDNPYTRTRSKYDTRWSIGNVCFYNSRTPNAACSNPTANCGIPQTFWDDSDENKLLNKLAAEVRTHDFNLGQTLGEGKQTIELVVSTIVGLKRSLIAGIHGRMGEVARFGGTRRLTQDALSSVYLRTVFGALPLIGDVFEAAKAYEAITKSRKSSLSVVHRIGRDYEGSCSPSNYKAPGRVQISKRIMYEMTERVSQARELGLLSPYQVLWELTPWSFLFDYFLPIGSYLENVALIPNLRGRFVVTLKQETSAATGAMPFYVSPDGYRYDLYRGGSSNYDTWSFTRTCPSTLSVPTPNLIDLRQALKPWRIANIVALSHQQVLKVVRSYS